MFTKGKHEKKCQKEESLKQKKYHEVYIFSKNLTKGHKLKKEDFLTLRPAKGLDPFHMKKLLKKKLTKNVKKISNCSKKNMRKTIYINWRI